MTGELAYGIWTHIYLLVQRAPSLFAAEFKAFYARESDLHAVKCVKLEALTAVADVGNA